VLLAFIILIAAPACRCDKRDRLPLKLGGATAKSDAQICPRAEKLTLHSSVFDKPQVARLVTRGIIGAGVGGSG
jgi:hypothetical protein